MSYEGIDSGARGARIPTLACLLVAASLLVLASACASGGGSDANRRLRIRHEHQLVPGRAHHAGITKAIVFPMNATVERTQGLEVANDRLMQILDEKLAAHGIESERLSAREYNRVNGIVIRRVRKQTLSGETGVASEKVRFPDIIPGMLDELGSEAQLVVLPNVVIREAAYSGRNLLRWDGVRRRERGTRGGSVTGSVGAGSIFTIILDRNGEKIFSAYGGLDPIFEMDLSKKKYVLREDLFADEKHLREGVCVSLHPFFGDLPC